jgi:hypothetical protein
MCRLRKRRESIPPTSAPTSVTRPATESPASPPTLQVIVASLDRTLGSDARTERALRLLHPVLSASVLTVIGVAFIVVAISTIGTWWSLVSQLGLTAVSVGAALMRRALVRRRKSDPSPALVVAPIPREATTMWHDIHTKPLSPEQPPSNRSGAGENGSGPWRAVGEGCELGPPSGVPTAAPVTLPVANRGGHPEKQNSG